MTGIGNRDQILIGLRRDGQVAGRGLASLLLDHVTEGATIMVNALKFGQSLLDAFMALENASSLTKYHLLGENYLVDMGVGSDDNITAIGYGNLDSMTLTNY